MGLATLTEAIAMPLPIMLLWSTASAALALLLYLLVQRGGAVSSSSPELRTIARALPNWPVRGALTLAIHALDTLTSAVAAARAAGVPDSIARAVRAQAAVGTDTVRRCAVRLAAVAHRSRAGRTRGAHPGRRVRRGRDHVSGRAAGSGDVAPAPVGKATQQARLALAEMTLSSHTIDDLPVTEAALRELGWALRERTLLYRVYPLHRA